MTTITENTANDMIETYRAKADWSTHGQCILMAFKALPYYSLSLERIIRVGSALADVKGLMDEDATKKQLSKMVRAKLLRSRRIQGVLHYELNF